MPERSYKIDQLAGLTLPEVFDRFIRDDPEIQALNELAIQRSSGEAAFLDVKNRLYVFPDTHWPVISSEWVNLNGEWGYLLYPETTDADAHLMKTVSDRFDLVLEPLRSGRLVGYGHLADGSKMTLNRNIWSTAGYFIDFNRSEVGRCSDQEKDVESIWFAVELRQPSVTAGTVKSAEYKTARRELGPGKKAVRAAHQALFLDGVPDGLRAKERNNKINDWLCENGRSRVSDRTIQRFYAFLSESSSSLK